MLIVSIFMMTGIRLELIQREIVARRVEDVRDAHQASDQAQMGVRTKPGHIHREPREMLKIVHTVGPQGLE